MITSFIKSHKLESVFVLLLFGVTFVLRFPQLGYSHFYGDETKTFYLDKTISASNFLLNQRKGPVQFLVPWITEKLLGGFDEFYTRLPFTIASVLAVFVLYLIVRKLFNYKVAFVASLLFSVNGFYIAFARTVQYQSFLLFFGFLAILFSLCYLESKNRLSLVLSAVFLALGFLAHYDALFFAIPVIYILSKNVSKQNLLLLTLGFVLPVAFLIGVFYIPYALKGFLVENTFGYIERRATGSNFAQNYSPYTLAIYNPLLITWILLLFGFLVFFKTMDWKKSMLVLWFFIPFVAFQFAMLNPGTHIHNYLIPLFILSGVVMDEILVKLRLRILRSAFILSAGFLFYVQIVCMLFIFIPKLSLGFPWVNMSFGPFAFSRPDKDARHLFLYGFPYNRGWDQVRDYLYTKDGVRNLYTNDNATIAEYYLQKLDVTPPGSNFLPQYYVYVFDNQEFRYPNLKFLLQYELEKEFFVEDTITAQLYRLKTN